VTLGALPAAGAASFVEYVALGDSYAAGWGAPPADPEDPCQRSAQGYPTLLDDAQKRIELEVNAACKGAKTADVINTQLSALNSDTRLVTLTVGGNDLNVADVAATCTRPGVTALQCITDIRNAVTPAKLQALDDALTDLYAKVAARAPDARIVVTGYPYLADPAPGSPIITALNAATDQLNATIKQAVTVTQNADVNIRYVDVTAEFAGHGIFSPNPFINPPGTEAAFHPNALGYSVYATAIADALPRGWVDKSSRTVASS
jgi:lysophospholipase L1-like esterase